MRSGENIADIITEGEARGLAADALRLLLEGAKSPHTRRAYEGDLADFFGSWGEELGAAGAELLFAMDARRLTLTLHDYVRSLRRRKLSEATINRRLSAVRALLKAARRLGATVPEPGEVASLERIEQYRDLSGPTVEEVARLLDAPDRATEKGRRDYALLLLLYSNGLRRGEALGCDVRDLDARRGRLRIRGKGRGSQAESVALLPETVAALQQYLDGRDAPAPGDPLFATCDRRDRGEGGRLTGHGLWLVLDAYGQKVLGRRLRPHQLRHTAVTEGLDATGGDIPTVQDFSRHKKVETVMIYRDRLRDGQGHVTRLLGERLQQARDRQTGD